MTMTNGKTLMKSLPKENLVELLTTMMRSRAFDQKIIDLFTQGSIPGFTHVGIGQEAIAAGVCSHLRQSDNISTTHRGHIQAVAKGIDVKRAMAEIFGKKSGFCKGKGGSMHLADKTIGLMGSTAIVGAGIPIATGAALSFQLQETGQIAVCFFGDGAVNHGTFHESLNMASLWKLPIVYCCENNSWSQFSPQTLTTKVLDVANRASAYAIPGVTVDGDNVLAVYEAAEAAIGRARKGDGPTLLECKTHRWYGHFVGDAQKYRTEEDLEECRQSDPIAKFAARLIEEKVLTPDEVEEARQKTQAEIDEAVKFAEESPLPEADELLAGVYYEGGN